MAGRVSVRVTKNRLPEIAKRLPAAAGIIVDRNGREMEATAKRMVPVDTGALRDSIQWSMTSDTEGQLSAAQEYAAYVEYGTRHMAAQPYLRPAREQQRPKFDAAFRRLEELLG